MINTTGMIVNGLKEYKSPYDKLSRMVRDGVYIPITKGIYETDASTPGYLLAGAIYGPSYLSFEYALQHYGMIPEGVIAFTSATFGKKKKKKYENKFGVYTYRDVPDDVYHLGIEYMQEGQYSYFIASREKAICDELYKQRPVSNYSELKAMLFGDLRIDEYELEKIDPGSLEIIAGSYPSTNVKRFYRYIRRNSK
jgi:Predicted transcriptional regulator